MAGGRIRPLGLAAISVLALAGQLATPAGADPPPPAALASFNVSTLSPSYDPQVHDYVVRCQNRGVRVDTHALPPWQVAVGAGPFRTGDRAVFVPLRTGREFTVTVQQSGSQEFHRYYVRCLPNNFPTYTFTKSGPVSPQFFTADAAFAPIPQRYAMIFDNNGVPIWWYHLSVQGPQVLPDGHILWFRANGQASQYEIRRLDGQVVRRLGTKAGASVDGHDLQLLPGGGYLVGGHFQQSGVDLSPYGGPTNADVLNAELQEIGPQGNLLWDWKSQNHIARSETGRWWPYIIGRPTENGYDVPHWNSIEPRGNAVIASFRQVDAVYKINKATGNIVWKLGGSTTPRSLTVLGDPRSYPLGGQHDARMLPDGTLSIFDNRTYLTNGQPRVVQYSIDQVARTATLVRSITDPDIPLSYCCGSARQLPNQDWLVNWGRASKIAQSGGSIGGYTPDGQRTFLLTFQSTFSYRAQPVPPGALSVKQLRKNMDVMCASGCP
jgi:hypothetical protein